MGSADRNDAAARVPPGAGRLTDGPPDPTLVGTLLAQALAGPTVRVPADPARFELSVADAITRLRGAATLSGASGVAVTGGVSGAATVGGASFRGVDQPRLDYALDVGPRVRLIALDLARRDGGSGGLVVPGQAPWVADQLAAAGAEGRVVVFVSHQALWDSVNGDQVLAVLDQASSVIATLSGHTHRNRIQPQATAAGGYWKIETASLIDYPQQARALRVKSTADGGVAIETWMLDHVYPGSLGTISRELSYLDAQGGRPQRFAGGRLDRNVVLYRDRPGSR